MKRIYLALMLVLAMYSCQQTPQAQQTEPKSSKEVVVENILARRSVRSYKPEQIKESELNEIMQCAINAPSAMNKQPWEIRVIQNPELLQAINEGFKNKQLQADPSRTFKEGFSVFHNSPTLIVVANDVNNAYSPVDCGLLGQNILLSAEAMEIGTCVIGGVIGYLNSPEAKDIIARLNLPEGYAPLYAISMGYKNESPDAKPRDAAKVQVIK